MAGGCAIMVGNGRKSPRHWIAAAVQPFNQPHDLLIGGHTMNINLAANLTPLAALIAGVLILLMPRLLNFIVAIYLIVIGIAGLTHAFH
jgi:hypothetical protein